VRLELRTAFGTSHSSTTFRENVRVHVSLTVGEPGAASVALQGVSEIGMPPLKPGVYEAVPSDVARMYTLLRVVRARVGVSLHCVT
jgi:hypothetical protein